MENMENSKEVAVRFVDQSDTWQASRSTPKNGVIRRYYGTADIKVDGYGDGLPVVAVENFAGTLPRRPFTFQKIISGIL